MSGRTAVRVSLVGAKLALFAGNLGGLGNADGAAADARFNVPYGVAVDGADNVYVVDSNNSTVRKITPAGVISTFAGTAGQRGDADGIGEAARFQAPRGLATDTAGNVYVADARAIRKITPSGVASTVDQMSDPRDKTQSPVTPARTRACAADEF